MQAQHQLAAHAAGMQLPPGMPGAAQLAAVATSQFLNPFFTLRP